MMPLALCYADAGTTRITWPKMSCCISFWLSWPNKWNGVIGDTVGFMIQWCQLQWHDMTKTLFCTLFQFSWSNECNGVIDEAISVMWCQQWHCMTKKVMMNLAFRPKKGLLTMPTALNDQMSHVTPWFNCLYLMNKMVSLMMQLTSHDWKSHVSLHFVHFNLMNVMVSLTILLALQRYV